MTKTSRRLLIFTGKGLVAAALLWWVLAQVHWRDYVVDKANGRTYNVEDAGPRPDDPSKLRVSSGPMWDRRTWLMDRSQAEPADSQPR